MLRGISRGLIVAVSDYYADTVDAAIFSISDSYNNTWKKAVDYQPGGRLIVVLGGTSDPMAAAEKLSGLFGTGPLVVGPTVRELQSASASARVSPTAEPPYFPSPMRQVPIHAPIRILPSGLLGQSRTIR